MHKIFSNLFCSYFSFSRCQSARGRPRLPLALFTIDSLTITFNISCIGFWLLWTCLWKTAAIRFKHLYGCFCWVQQRTQRNSLYKEQIRNGRRWNSNTRRISNLADGVIAHVFYFFFWIRPVRLKKAKRFFKKREEFLKLQIIFKTSIQSFISFINEGKEYSCINSL